MIHCAIGDGSFCNSLKFLLLCLVGEKMWENMTKFCRFFIILTQITGFDAIVRSIGAFSFPSISLFSQEPNRMLNFLVRSKL